MSLAYRVRTAAGEAGIYVTDQVRERLEGAYPFEQAGTVTGSGTAAPVWRCVSGGEG